MRTVLESIAAIDGPKSVIVISEGLVFEGLGGESDDLAGVAADSRASIDCCCSTCRGSTRRR